MTAGFSMMSTVMTKILGAQIISDVQTFVRAFEALFGGFRQRATSTFELLSSRHSTFLVVATPQHDALREAEYFVDRLTEEGMPLSGMVLNLSRPGGGGLTPSRRPDAHHRNRDQSDGALRRSSSGGGPNPGSVLADRRHGSVDTPSRRYLAV